MPELTYGQLQTAVKDLARTVARNAETVHHEGQQIAEEARDTARVADQIGGMKVDTATIGETQQVSKIMAGLSNAAIAYAATGADTFTRAKDVWDVNRVSHAGIGEAMHRSPVGAQIFDVDRTWFTQE